MEQAGESYLRSKAGLLEKAMRGAALDDLGFCHQDIHEISSRHEIEKEVQVILVLKAGVLSYAEWVRSVPGDGLFAQDMLRAGHHS